VRPPRSATWLLTHLVRNDALIGDLREQYRHRRSFTWYWRQVISAIVIATINEIRNHKVLALRGFVIGYALLWMYFRYLDGRVFSIVYQTAYFHEFLFVTGVTSWFYLHHIRLPLAPLALSYWVIGPVTDSLGWLAVGWLVGRFQGARIALAFSVVYVCGLIPTATSFLATIPRVIVYLCQAYFSVLAGGLWGSSRPEGWKT
jgi:hypothetical protein